MVTILTSTHIQKGSIVQYVGDKYWESGDQHSPLIQSGVIFETHNTHPSKCQVFIDAEGQKKATQ